MFFHWLSVETLTPSAAKLYSQRSRIISEQPSLTSWRINEANERLDDAVRLIEASFIKREAGDVKWQLGVRRAGELLEWLSLPEFKLENVPVRMLAARGLSSSGLSRNVSRLVYSRN